VRDRLSELGDNTDVVLVTFTGPANLDSYSRDNKLDFPILIDANRDAYRSFGLGRGSIWRIYGWRAMHRYLEIFKSDRLKGLRRPTEDTLQLGGDFIVDPDGNLLYGFWGDGPDDRPSVDELIGALQGAPK